MNADSSSDAADIQWLTGRWRLPETLVPTMEGLLAAHRRGSTASEISAIEAEMIEGWRKQSGATLTQDAPDPLPWPVVVVRAGNSCFVQSWLHHKAEKEIARDLQARACVQDNVFSWTEQDQASLFPKATTGDRQVCAVGVAMERRLALITGGPGTGKTYTLARILAMLVKHGVKASELRLAAPTGKAADRMKGVVGDSLSQLPEAFGEHLAELGRVANSSSTLHSLLGYNPATGQCRYNERHPIPCRAVIVDECSMVDVLLWRALLKALAPETKLILLGDPNQLESVGRGNVLAELVRQAEVSASSLHPCWVRLTVARRFQNLRGIQDLARALVESDADAAEKLLMESHDLDAPEGVAWFDIGPASLRWEGVPPTVRNALVKVAVAPDAGAALAALAEVCVLTAQRDDFVGCMAMNRRIDEQISREVPRQNGLNQPIIINCNDSETKLRNGTLGVIRTEPSGSRKAYFPGIKKEDPLRDYSVAELPEYSPAWALTIHRSQGSEFKLVLVVLPQDTSPLNTRELIYTAITRAKEKVFVAGPLASIRVALQKSADRTTLVGAYLSGSA
jgi:exodeoxyribonuclease V alpha subunit